MTQTEVIANNIAETLRKVRRFSTASHRIKLVATRLRDIFGDEFIEVPANHIIGALALFCGRSICPHCFAICYLDEWGDQGCEGCGSKKDPIRLA